MLAAAAEVGIARGNRFPSIALTAKGGQPQFDQRFNFGQPLGVGCAGLADAPRLQFGRLRRAEQAAMERYTQSALTYEQTVLTAFSDVEQALVAITTYRRQTERYGELVLANDRIAAMTQALYRSGLSDYLDVIDAQRSLYQSQMEFVNLVAQQYINYVNLCKALGGGW
ncbi:MAG: TolC family protein [Alistipes finegoldii]